MSVRLGTLAVVAAGLLLASPAGAAPVGELTYAGCVTDAATGCATTSVGSIPSVGGIAVSPDGRSLYVTSFSASTVTRFDRDPATGALTPRGCLTRGSGCGAGADGIESLLDAREIAVSPDGRNVYVVSPTADAVAVLTRDPTTGAIAYAGCVSQAATGGCGSAPALDSPVQLAVTPDGGAVVVASSTANTLSVFTRNPTTGALTYSTCFQQGTTLCGANNVVGLAGANGVTVSADSRAIYVAASTSQAIARFTRDPQTGAVTYRGCETATSGCPNGANALAPLSSAYRAVVDPLGRNLYAIGQASNFALTTFDRDAASGALTFRSCFDRGSVCGGGRDGLTQLTWPQALTISSDGRSVYVLGSNAGDAALTRFDRDPRDGTLTRQDCFANTSACPEHGTFDPIYAALTTAIAPDGSEVYVGTSGKLLRFRRVMDAPPACAPPASLGTTPGTSLRIALACADANGDPFSVRFPSAPAHGAVAQSADGSAFYVPNAGFSGTDRFTVQAVDVYGVAGPIATVDVTVAFAVPALSRLTLSPARFRAAPRGGSAVAAARRRAPVGTKVGYRLDRAATVRFTVTKRAPGVRRGKRCVAPPRRPALGAKPKRCTRTVTLGGLTRASRAGANAFRFTGRVKRRALAPGAYTLSAVAQGAGGTRSARLSRRFTIVR